MNAPVVDRADVFGHNGHEVVLGRTFDLAFCRLCCRIIPEESLSSAKPCPARLPDDPDDKRPQKIRVAERVLEQLDEDRRTVKVLEREPRKLTP